jgi:hypothetical protein
VANTYTYPSADLHPSANVYPVADAHAYPCADLHAIPDVYTGSDVHTLPDTEGRADLYTLAHVDTYTCGYGHGSAYPDTDCDCANTDAGCDCYGSTDTHTDCGHVSNSNSDQ